MTVKFPMKQRTLLKTVAKGGFLSSRLVRWKLLKKLPQSHWQARWVWRLFYIMLLQCILDFHQKQGVSLCTIMPHYVKKLGEKNYWRKLRSVRVFSKNCASNFFWSVGKGGVNWNVKLPFTTKRKSIVVRNEISEMKQTKMRVQEYLDQTRILCS